MSEETERLARMNLMIQQTKAELKAEREVLKERAGALKLLEEQFYKESLDHLRKKD